MTVALPACPLITTKAAVTGLDIVHNIGALGAVSSANGARCRFPAQRGVTFQETEVGAGHGNFISEAAVGGK